MKKLIFIIVIAFTVMGCEAIEKQQIKNIGTIKVYDGFDVNRFNVIEIEGCEFYEYDGNRQYGLTKVDCNCIPDKSKRLCN